MGNFKENEILGYTYIEGKRVTVLKQGIKRIRKYYSVLEEDDMGQLNQEIIHLQRYSEYLKRVVGIDDFDEEMRSNRNERG